MGCLPVLVVGPGRQPLPGRYRAGRCTLRFAPGAGKQLPAENAGPHPHDSSARQAPPRTWGSRNR